MELKKPNQISIKLNGSPVQSKKEDSTSRTAGRTRPTKETRPVKETMETREPKETMPQFIPTLVPKPPEEEPQVIEESSKPVESITEEDALYRLNQLRYQTENKPRLQDNLEEYSQDNQENQQYLDGPIIDLDHDERHEDSTWIDRLRTKRTGFQKGMFSSLPPFTRTPWFRMMASSVGAVALGLVFGFTVLMVFKEEQLSQSYKTVLGETLQIPGQTQQSANAPIPAAGSTVTNPAASQTNPTQQPTQSEETIQTLVTVPEQNFYLAQAGVFSDIASAQPAIEPLQKQGFPHLLYEIEGKQHLFVATAPTRDEILGIASFLKNSKMDVYIKELAFPPLEKEMKLPRSLVSTDPINPDNNKVENFLVNGFELARSLSAFSSKVLNQSGSQQTITSEEETKLRDLHRRFLDEGRVVQASVPQEWQPLFKNMIEGLNQAVTAMTGLKTQNASPYAWQVQTGVFQFVENYVSWSKSSLQ